jgi:hypothetical protein
MLRGISTLISHKRKVLVRYRPFFVIRGGARMTDKIPHVPKQVYTQLAGHINNFNLGIGVVNIVTQRPGDDGITRRFIPLHGASEIDMMFEKQRQVARRGERTHTSAVTVTAAHVNKRLPRALDRATDCPEQAVRRNLVRTNLIPFSRVL